jgi:hypothetical protein
MARPVSLRCCADIFTPYQAAITPAAFSAAVVIRHGAARGTTITGFPLPKSLATVAGRGQFVRSIATSTGIHGHFFAFGSVQTKKRNGGVGSYSVYHFHEAVR